MICINCGRAINGKICDCCGADYRSDEEKKTAECNHLFDSVIYEDHPIDLTANLIFKCHYCNHTVVIRTSQKYIKVMQSYGSWLREVMNNE